MNCCQPKQLLLTFLGPSLVKDLPTIFRDSEQTGISVYSGPPILMSRLLKGYLPMPRLTCLPIPNAALSYSMSVRCMADRLHLDTGPGRGLSQPMATSCSLNRSLSTISFYRCSRGTGETRTVLVHAVSCKSPSTARPNHVEVKRSLYHSAARSTSRLITPRFCCLPNLVVCHTVHPLCPTNSSTMCCRHAY